MLAATVALSAGVAGEAPTTPDVPSIRTDLRPESPDSTPPVGAPLPDVEATRSLVPLPAEDSPGTSGWTPNFPGGSTATQADPAPPASDALPEQGADSSDDEQDDEDEDRETVKPPVRDDDDHEDDDPDGADENDGTDS